MKPHLLECVEMQNYRVEVQNHSEAIEAQELFFNLGYSWFHKKFEAIEIKTPETIMCFENGALTTGIRGSAKHKQITLPELRDMVAPKQKEYLVKTDTGYTLQVLSDVVDGHDGIIEVPDGAMAYWECDRASVKFFSKLEEGCHFYHYLNKNSEWVLLGDADFKIFEMKWQREELNDQVASAEKARQEQNHGALVGLLHHGFSGFTQPEELPFVSDTQQTLNERQSQYGDFKDVAGMTQELLAVMEQYGYSDMPYMHKEALHMICSKMARIVNGDHNHLDSWHDIGGYAKLIENNIN